MFTSSGGTRGAALLSTELLTAPVEGAGSTLHRFPLRHELVQGEHRRAYGTESGQRTRQAQDEGARQDAGQQDDRPTLGQGLGVIGICHVPVLLEEILEQAAPDGPGGRSCLCERRGRRARVERA